MITENRCSYDYIEKSGNIIKEIIESSTVGSIAECTSRCISHSDCCAFKYVLDSSTYQYNCVLYKECGGESSICSDYQFEDYIFCQKSKTNDKLNISSSND